MKNNPEKQELELLPELLLQGERGPGICQIKRASYANINLIVRRKNHRRPSVPVVVTIQIDTTNYLNYHADNRKSTNLELAMGMELYCKRHAASEHNRKQ